MIQPAKSVPVVPNFTQSFHDYHTETTSKVTETINSIDYATGWQYSVSGTNVTNGGTPLRPPSNTSTVVVNPLGGVEGQVTSQNASLNFNNASGFTIKNPGEAFQFTQTYSGAWNHKSNRDTKNNRSYFSNRYHKYLYPVIGLLIASPVSAADVGGVSATANPIANSSGPVTNQAIQVLQGPYITNTYGGGISCQGPTMNFTPYVTHSISDKDPFEQRYFEPQYDNRDFVGRTVQVQKIVKNFPWETWYDDRTYTNSEGEEVRAYEDGADMTIIVDEIQGDGVPDNPGDILWEKLGTNWRKNKLQYQHRIFCNDVISARWWITGAL